MSPLPRPSGPRAPLPAHRGFTLIELLIVVVVIGILAMIAVPKFARTRERAARASMAADLRNLATAQEGYFFRSRTYSTDLDSLEFRGSSNVSLTVNEATEVGWSATARRAGFSSTCHIFYGNAAPPVAGARADRIHCED